MANRGKEDTKATVARMQDMHKLALEGCASGYCSERAMGIDAEETDARYDNSVAFE